MTYKQAACYIIDEAKQLITVDAGVEPLANNSIRNDHLTNIDYTYYLENITDGLIKITIDNRTFCTYNIITNELSEFKYN